MVILRVKKQRVCVVARGGHESWIRDVKKRSFKGKTSSRSVKQPMSESDACAFKLGAMTTMGGGGGSNLGYEMEDWRDGLGLSEVVALVAILIYLGLLADSLTLRMCEGVKGSVQTIHQ